MVISHNVAAPPVDNNTLSVSQGRERGPGISKISWHGNLYMDNHYYNVVCTITSLPLCIHHIIVELQSS